MDCSSVLEESLEEHLRVLDRGISVLPNEQQYKRVRDLLKGTFE